MNKKVDEKEESKALSVGNGGGLAVAADFLSDDDFNGAGFEGADSSTFAIPFIQILQKMSPLVDEDSPKHIEGAKAGMFYNTVTGQLVDGKAGLQFVPCAYKRSYIEWGGREGDGGFKGEFTPEQYEEMVGNKEITIYEGRGYRPDKNGHVDVKKSNYFADTRSHYVITLDPNGGSGMAVISLSATQTKASRTLMTLLQTKKVDVKGVKRTPPPFANIVKMTTVPMSNDKGSWSGAKFELIAMVEDKVLFTDAKSFYQNIIGGKMKADHAKSEYSATGDGGVAEGAQEAENF